MNDEKLSSCSKLKENKGISQLNAINNLESGRSSALKDIVGTFAKIYNSYSMIENSIVSKLNFLMLMLRECSWKIFV